MARQSQGSVHGAGRDAFGDRVTVYRAVAGLVCAGCGSTIGAGELFTRAGTRPGVRTRPMPHCASCRPFSVSVLRWRSQGTS